MIAEKKSRRPAAASSVERVAPNILFWSAYEPAVKCDLSSTAYRSADGWVLVDPIPIEPALSEELFSADPPIAVFLTSEHHERASLAYRSQWKLPIYASEQAEGGLDIRIDRAFHPREPVHGLLPVPIPGATQGETAFLSRDGLLVLGDAVINLESEGLALLPGKYCRDEAGNRASLKKLLDYEFSIVTFAHGTPLRTQARERLRALLG